MLSGNIARTHLQAVWVKCQLLACRQPLPGQVQLLQTCTTFQILDTADLIVFKIQLLQPSQVLQTCNLLYPILLQAAVVFGLDLSREECVVPVHSLVQENCGQA